MEQEKPHKQSIFSYKLTGTTALIVILLVLSLIALAERVLYDLSRIFVGNNFDYFDNLQTILIHAFLILPLLILSIIINILVAEKKQKYAMIIIPYFVLSIVLALQLSLEMTVYFVNHHTKFEFYLVMSLLVAVCTIAIYFIQKRFELVDY